MKPAAAKDVCVKESGDPSSRTAPSPSASGRWRRCASRTFANLLAHPGSLVLGILSEPAEVRHGFDSQGDRDRGEAGSVVGAGLTHHNASAQVEGSGAATRFVWIADLLPDEAAPRIAAMIEQGLAAIRETLESDAGV